MILSLIKIFRQRIDIAAEILHLACHWMKAAVAQTEVALQIDLLDRAVDEYAGGDLF